MVLKIEFNKEFERKFRELAMRKYGFSKGSIKKAGEEAIKIWIELEDRELPKRVKKAGYVSKYLENAKLWVKPVDNLEKLYKQGRWYGRNILRYFKNSRDYATLGAVLTYASLLPLLILGIIYRPILILFAVPFALILYYTLRGLFITGSPYAFAMIPIAFVRGTGQLVGMIESPFKKGGGKVS